MKKSKRIILITGETSGFGKIMADLFLENNDIVCGFSRSQNDNKNIYHQIVDISNENNVKQGVKNIIEKYGHIDILINNAGFGIFGPVEKTDLNDATKLVNVNFLGAYIVTKEVLPYMRKENKGKIFNISSIGATIPLPYQAFYSATKNALDTLFDALRSEIKPYKISITSIKPGDAKTNFTKNRQYKPIDKNSYYFKPFNKCLEQVSKDENNGISPKKIAKVVYNLSFRKHPPYSKCVGFKDTLLLFIYKILPKKLASYLLYKIYASN